VGYHFTPAFGMSLEYNGVVLTNRYRNSHDNDDSGAGTIGLSSINASYYF
jgi:hypothetical protein